MEDRLPCPAEAKVRGPLALRNKPRGCPNLGRITRHENLYTRKRGHNGDVLQRVVSIALTAIRVSSSDRDDLHVRTVVTNIIADLLQAAQRREVADRIDEHGFSR